MIKATFSALNRIRPGCGPKAGKRVGDILVKREDRLPATLPLHPNREI